MPEQMIIDNQTNINALYSFIKSHFTFDQTIQLYKLLKFKIENLEDKPITDFCQWDGEDNE